MTQNHTRIIVLLCLISSLGRFVLDSYLPSMPSIDKHFGLTTALSQHTLTIYLLGFALSQLVYGPLSDIYGRRRLIIIGLGIFVTGNLICTVATSPTTLLIARLVAGMGAGSCGVLNRAIASDCFAGAEFSKAWSYTTTALVLTLCLAPIVGGYLEQWLGWRANFAVSTFYVSFVLLLILRFLPETVNRNTPLNEKVFSLRQIGKDYWAVLTAPSFIAGTLSYTLAFSGLIAYFQVSPCLFMQTFSLTPSQYGWCSMIIAANYLLGGVFVSKTVHRLGTNKLLFLGTGLLILGGAFMLAAYYYHIANLWVTLFASSIYVLGARIIIPNAIANSMQELRHLGGSSSAMIGCIQMLGSSLISLIIAMLTSPPLLTLSSTFILLGGMTLLCLSVSRPSYKS